MKASHPDELTEMERADWAEEYEYVASCNACGTTAVECDAEYCVECGELLGLVS